MLVMKAFPKLDNRLAEILHEGCIEIRSLALDGGHEAQIADLADVLEYLPRFLATQPTPEEWDTIRATVYDYTVRYPGLSQRLLEILG